MIKEKNKRYDPTQLYRRLSAIFGEEYDVRGNEYRINCFKCGEKTGNLEINLLSGWFHCWKCGYSGRQLIKILKDHLGYAPKIEEYVSEDELRRFKPFEKEEPEEEAPKFKGLPEGFVPFTGKETFQGEMALNWLLKRMTFESILKHRIGYCLSGKYRDRIIVPCYENGDVVYFSARSIANRVKPKYLNPDEAEFGGEGKGKVVFNIEGARKDRQAVLCEGVFDAMHVGDDGVCIFGTDPSEDQIAKLSQGIDRIYVILDYDARVKSYQVSRDFLSSNIYKTLTGAKFDVRCIVLPKGGDPDEYPRETIRQLIQHSKPLSFVQEVMTIFA
jgi:DNA primase